METRATYCRICEAACGLLADVQGERVVRLRPDPDHVVSKGFVCAKGTRFTGLHASADRVERPLVRQGGKLEPTSWNAAIADIGDRIRKIQQEHGPHSVAVYLGNPSAFGYALALTGIAFVRGLGTRNFFSAGSLDCNNKFVVAREMLGSPATHPVPDLDRARFALLLGTNPSVSQSSFVNAPRMLERLKAIEARGGSVVVVDPRRTETAKSVGRHLPIVPDTDAALLLAMLHVVFDEGLDARHDLSRYARGVDDLRAAVERFSPERVAPVTRIPAGQIRDLARHFALADGAFCHLSTGVNQGSFGAIAYAAKIALELATGNLDRPGGALLQRGALDTARLARVFGVDREPKWRSRIGGLPTVMGALPTAILADEILTPGAGKVRALIVIAGNPLLGAPDGARLERALGELELCVGIDMFVNDTGAHATHVLPCTDFLEREDLPLAQLQLQPTPYVQWTDPVVPPRGERHHDWQILFDIAKAAGAPLGGSRAADLALRGAVAAGGTRALVLPALVPALGPRPLHKLRAHPHGILVKREKPGRFLKRSRRVNVFPRAVYGRLGELEATLNAAEAHGDGVVLRLFTKRERLGHNSWMHANGALDLKPQRAFVSPEDASRLGVKSGDRLRLSTDAGAIELPVEVTPDIAPGAVAVPHGYGHHAGSGWSAARARGGQNVNLLAASGPGSVDPLTGMCRFVGVPVRAERVAKLATDAPAPAG